jgi:hypothetical protein
MAGSAQIRIIIVPGHAKYCLPSITVSVPPVQNMNRETASQTPWLQWQMTHQHSSVASERRDILFHRTDRSFPEWFEEASCGECLTSLDIGRMRATNEWMWPEWTGPGEKPRGFMLREHRLIRQRQRTNGQHGVHGAGQIILSDKGTCLICFSGRSYSIGTPDFWR